MSKHITDKGETSFLGDKKVRCQRYEWSVPNPKAFGRFKVKLLCPLEKHPRRFFVEPILQNWTKEKAQSQFLKRACACGHKILVALDALDPGLREAFPLFQSVFRNRHAGHIQVSRQFANLLDFVDLDPSRTSPGLITSDFETPFVPWSDDLREMVRDLFSQALQEKPSRLDANTFIETYQKHVNDQYASRTHKIQPDPMQIRLDRLFGKCHLDLFFTDGLVRHAEFDLGYAMEKVRRSMIYGPCTAMDFGQGVEDKGYRHFCSRIFDAAKSSTVRDFDKWLRNQRQHGYVNLLEGSSGRGGGQKEEIRERTTRMFCALLWQSYQEMARCYGALMLVVWLDLCLEFKLTTVEEILFRQLSFPQLYLGGIPLAFLGRSQLRWIAAPLLNNWRDWSFEPEAYDVLTELLGTYADLVSARRDADRRTKTVPLKDAIDSVAIDAINSAATKDTMNESFELNEPGKYPELATTLCPKCGGDLRPEEILGSLRDGWLLVDMDCPKCGRVFRFRVNPKRFQQ